ncbi:trans-sulfuration enzyme family protein [Raineya orbicola]|uniref:Cystathionine beta-lyase/cystathionine gamma-synthase n=1 Tax=Raineya orbicola TaxID=2016530 RepID=A0A2N3IJX2_9BACT|nr:aminotransferase class I/II-fold pyridoxal phosphate-dependent enzyme [Raineya orbicola]PKQ70523.1 Cystathionine beta-lyase/cystathionine gamma-synthase [Raineya orbicola]
MDISYIINELGEERENYLYSVAPPIFQTAMSCFPSVEAMRQSLAKESETPFYTRGNNATTDILRKKMAALEETEDALIFASGSAAIAAAVLSVVETGDHIVCMQKPYSWTNKLLNLWLKRFGVSATMIDGTKPENYEKAIQPNTKLLFLETPNSFTFELQDIEAVVKIARKYNLTTILDNSYATPLNQKPATIGVDMVVHSATKYLAGHSDAVGGVLCGKKVHLKKIFESEFMTIGGIISPFNAWLILRGLRTLPIRMQRVAETTPKIVNFLASHPKVSKIYYPFHPSHPQFELAKKQMKAPTGQFSIELKADNMQAVERFCNNLRRFLLAASWGSYESLIFPACTLYTSENYASAPFHWSLIRFYIGLEESDALIADLEQALAQI